MSGSRKPGSIPTYPDLSIQSTVVPSNAWWVKDHTHGFERGRLVRAFIPHVDQLPYVLIEEGRREAVVHETFTCKVEPLDVKKPQKRTDFPVAGMPAYDGEVKSVYRAKKRPAVIIAEPGKEVPKELTLGKPKRHTAPTLLVAPYYGADESGQRAGFSQAFLDRVCKCEYSQFMLDWLPLSGSPAGSILRVDHIQPVGFHHNSLEPTAWRLSEAAIDVLFEWIVWHFEGSLPKDGLLECLIEMILDEEPRG